MHSSILGKVVFSKAEDAFRAFEAADAVVRISSDTLTLHETTMSWMPSRFFRLKFGTEYWACFRPRP